MMSIYDEENRKNLKIARSKLLKSLVNYYSSVYPKNKNFLKFVLEMFENGAIDFWTAYSTIYAYSSKNVLDYSLISDGKSNAIFVITE